MSQLTQNTTDLDALIAKANALPDAGSGGAAVETCTVTIIQGWGMNDDPMFLHLKVPYYNVLANGDIEFDYVELTSANDYEPQHSVTFTAYKNIPINVSARTSGPGEVMFTVSSKSGATIHETLIANETMLYSIIPTDNTATVTISSP